MAWQAIASIGANIAGSMYQQRQARKRAQEQMAFQERMSSSAFQRAVNDMRKAGINPIMASKLGGASTPTGAMAPTPEFGDIGKKGMEALATAQQIKQSTAQTNNIREQSKVHSTVAELNSAKTLVEEQRARTEQLIQQEKRANIEGKKIANTLALQTQRYFKKLGYPPQVLTAKWQNIAGTYVWENLEPRSKQLLVEAINDFAKSSTKNAREFMNDPVGTMMSMMKGIF
jgi:hypothetical protein